MGLFDNQSDECKRLVDKFWQTHNALGRKQFRIEAQPQPKQGWCGEGVFYGECNAPIRDARGHRYCYCQQIREQARQQAEEAWLD